MPTQPDTQPAESESSQVRSSRSTEPRVSVTLPIYDEADLLPELLRRVLLVVDRLPGGPHELLFVDDGSTDESLSLLRSAAREDPRIAVLSLSRNFGHQAAITAGLEHAAGDVVVVMDGDLQDPPETLPLFLERYRAGFDVVYATRTKRKESLWLRAAYYLFYRLIGLLAERDLPIDSGDFALLSRRVVDAINSAPERNRYLRGLRCWVGFRQCGLEIERDRRRTGKSKYTLRRLLALAFDGIFAFSTVPLRTATLGGAVAIFITSAYGAYALFARLFLGVSPPGFTALIGILIFVSGVQLLFLGVLGEYIGRIYEEVKRRPRYILCERIRGSGKGEPALEKPVSLEEGGEHLAVEPR